MNLVLEIEHTKNLSHLIVCKFQSSLYRSTCFKCYIVRQQDSRKLSDYVLKRLNGCSTIEHRSYLHNLIQVVSLFFLELVSHLDLLIKFDLLLAHQLPYHLYFDVCLSLLSTQLSLFFFKLINPTKDIELLNILVEIPLQLENVKVLFSLLSPKLLDHYLLDLNFS